MLTFVLPALLGCAASLANTVEADEAPGLRVHNATGGEVVCHVRVGTAGGAAAAADLLGPTEVLPPGALLELPPAALPDESTLDVRLEDCNGARLLEHVAVPRGPGIRVVLRARPTRLRGPRAHVGPSD